MNNQKNQQKVVLYYYCDLCENDSDLKNKKIISCVEKFLNLSVSAIHTSKKHFIKLTKNRNIPHQIFLSQTNQFESIRKELSLFENKSFFFDANIFINHLITQSKIVEQFFEKYVVSSMNSSKPHQWVNYFDPNFVVCDEFTYYCVIPFMRLDIHDECIFTADNVIIYQHPILCILIRKMMWHVLKRVQPNYATHLPKFMLKIYDTMYNDKTLSAFNTFAVCTKDSKSDMWRSHCIVQTINNELIESNQIEWTNLLCFPFRYIV